MNEWKPIETAPKDGSSILLGSATYVDAGYWDADVWALYPDDAQAFGVQRFNPPPTHWMPLPEPPAQSA